MDCGGAFRTKWRPDHDPSLVGSYFCLQMQTLISLFQALGGCFFLARLLNYREPGAD